MNFCEAKVLWELWGGAVGSSGEEQLPAGDLASLRTLGYEWWVPWLCSLCGVWSCVMGSLCLHQELLRQGCVFQERQGWERPGWFNPQETAQVSEDPWPPVYVTGRPWASHTPLHLSILPATQVRLIYCASGCVTGQLSAPRKLRES